MLPLLLSLPLARADDAAAASPYQTDLVHMSDLRGYAEIRGSYTDAYGTPWTLVERLRPTLKISPSERLSLEATFDAHLEQGRYAPAEAEALMRDQLGDDLFDTFLDLYGCTLDTQRSIDSVGDVVGVDRLFIDFNRPWADIRIGRQAVNWGSALVFNPTDVFAEVIVAEPWRERKGVDAARVTVPLGERAQIMGVAGVDGIDQGEITGGRGGLKGTLRTDRLAASLVGYTDGDRWFGGVDLKGDLAIGYWLEGGWDGDLRASAGVDYSFPVLNVLYVAAQVSYNGSGSAPADYDWSSLSGMSASDVATCESAPEGSPLGSSQSVSGTNGFGTMGRLYGIGVVNQAINEDLSLGLTTLWNLEDGTGLVFPSGSWAISGRIALNAGVQVLLGEDGEFRPPADVLQSGPVDLSPLLPRWTASAWARYSL